ncbi:hypothetical protein HDU97_004626 [Phlyctochytrium planicorne]|nr:hypothetical protein HDU97_004626 [Phlyctochytrium planicorne]
MNRLNGQGLETNEIVVDRDAISETFTKESLELESLRQKADQIQQQELAIEKSVESRLGWFRWTGLTYISTQAAAIIYFTVTLGWDVMEPVAYIVSLANMTLGGAFFVILRREPSPGRVAEWFQSLTRQNLWRRAKFNGGVGLHAQIKQHEELLQPLRKL